MTGAAIALSVLFFSEMYNRPGEKEGAAMSIGIVLVFAAAGYGAEAAVRWALS